MDFSAAGLLGSLIAQNSAQQQYAASQATNQRYKDFMEEVWKEDFPTFLNKPLKQFKIAIKYAIHRYGTLCNAWDAWQRQGWY